MFEIWWILLIEYIPSVVARFLLNRFCSLDSCISYHGLIRSKMILMISLHTIDPMLNPLYLLGYDFDPFPIQRILSLELPQTGLELQEYPGLTISYLPLLAFPNFNWRRCFWISSMVGTSWLIGKLFEIFCNSRTNSRRLSLGSLGATESTRLVGLKCFLNRSKILSEGHFPGAGFKVDSCSLVREKSLSSSLLIADWLILASSPLKYSFLKNLARSLIFFRVFDSSLELTFWGICWSSRSYSSFNMISSCHDW